MARTREVIRVLALAAAITTWAARVDAQQVVLISLPSAVSFNVADVMQDTVGTPTTVSFTVLNLLLFHAVQISVKADADFTPPSGASIPASNVSWTTSNASFSTGFSGTLSTASYGAVLRTPTSLLGSGSIDVQWTLAAPGASIRAGTHAAVMRWRLESVVP
jgi:hypothetical protein